MTMLRALPVTWLFANAGRANVLLPGGIRMSEKRPPIRLPHHTEPTTAKL